LRHRAAQQQFTIARPLPQSIADERQRFAREPLENGIRRQPATVAIGMKLMLLAGSRLAVGRDSEVYRGVHKLMFLDGVITDAELCGMFGNTHFHSRGVEG
jgi:uncharacterized membrane protein